MGTGGGWRTAVALNVCVLITGCSELSTHQQRALREWDARGLKVEEVNEDTAFELGFLLGMGSFYSGQYAEGTAALMTWPLSACWDPVVARQAAEALNYWATRKRVDEFERRDFDDLEARWLEGALSRAQYVRERTQIRTRYSGESETAEP